MKALTVYQPWASLIAIGVKQYEFRSKAPPRTAISERVAIHAGKRPGRPAELRLLRRTLSTPESAKAAGLRDRLAGLRLIERIIAGEVEAPLGVFVCTAIVGRPLSVREYGPMLGIMLNDSDRDEHFNVAIPLSEVRPAPPVPARGFQSWWTVPDSLAATLEAGR